MRHNIGIEKTDCFACIFTGSKRKVSLFLMLTKAAANCHKLELLCNENSIYNFAEDIYAVYKHLTAGLQFLIIFAS